LTLEEFSTKLDRIWHDMLGSRRLRSCLLDCDVVYLKMGARRRDNLGVRRRDSHGLLENGRAAARQPGRAAARQSWPGFARDGRCASLLNKCVINEQLHD